MAAPDIEIVLQQGSMTLSPVSRDVIAALMRVEVRRGEVAPSGFELTFAADVEGTDIDFIATQFADPFSRVQISVNIADMESVNGGSISAILIEGFVTAQDYIPETAERGGMFIVTGEDASVKMDMVERSVEYSTMADSDIVQTILGRYGSLVEASVTAPYVDTPPALYVPQQNGTDLSYLRHLARRHGAVFYVASSGSGKPVAYWGPPQSAPASVHALTVGAGSESNVKEIRFHRSMLAPTVTYGAVLDIGVSPPARSPVVVGSASRSQGYAAMPELVDDSALASDPEDYVSDLPGLAMRGTIVPHAGMDVATATGFAQGLADRSTDAVVTVTGALDTSDYGDLLLAPGMVEVRGAGNSFDGKYYLSEAVHIIEFADDANSYTQHFTLTRDGTGATASSVMA